MSVPLIMLDVDGVILPLPADELERDEDGILWPTGCRTPISQLEMNLYSVWADAARVLPLGASDERVYSPSMVEGLNQLANDTHAHVVWHSSWVLWPYILDDLIRRLDLPVGVQLDGSGSHPQAWARSKPAAIRDRVAAFREQVADAGPVVVLDDDTADWGPGLSTLLGAEVITPRPQFGLTPVDMELVRRALTEPPRMPSDPTAARRSHEPGVSTDF